MIRRVDRFWRQIGTGISFLVFGLGGLVMALFIFPLVNLAIRDKTRRTQFAQRLVQSSWKAFIWFAVTLRVIEVEADGEALLQGERGTIVIANHPSLLDVVLIMSLMSRTQCVVKPGVWKNPFMRGAIRATNYIPNLGDPEQVMRDCVTALEAGNNLMIFPEGSRTVPGHKPNLKRGFANIAVRAHAPVRLVAVSCEPPILRKGERWYQCPLDRPRFRVRVCELVDTERFIQTGIPSRAARDLTAHVTRRFEEFAAYGTA